MTASFTGRRILTADEAAHPDGINFAKQVAFREAAEAAEGAFVGPGSIPQNHSIDETVAPTDDGGVEVTVTITTPDPPARPVRHY